MKIALEPVSINVSVGDHLCTYMLFAKQFWGSHSTSLVKSLNYSHIAVSNMKSFPFPFFKKSNSNETETRSISLEAHHPLPAGAELNILHPRNDKRLMDSGTSDCPVASKLIVLRVRNVQYSKRFVQNTAATLKRSYKYGFIGHR